MSKKTRSRDFGDPSEENADVESVEPVKFKLSGEWFECHADIGGLTLLELTDKLTDGDSAVRGLLDFFDEVLIEEDKERFRKLAKDPKKHIKIELLTDIVQYVLEEYSDRDPKE